MGIKRPGLAIVGCCAMMVAVAGCGGGAAERGGAAVEKGGAAAERTAAPDLRDALPTIGPRLKWAAAIVPSASLAQAADGLGTAFENGTNIRDEMERIAGSDKPFGEALVLATCQGLSALANQYQQFQNSQGNQTLLTPTEQAWSQYLQNAVAAWLPREPLTTITNAVSGYVNAANLSNISPAAAVYYVQACVLKRER
jgi:hypothetical protein